jgi:hypothetical protein
MEGPLRLIPIQTIKSKYFDVEEILINIIENRKIMGEINE